MSNILRSEYIKEVRSWKGTPFKHQGRIKGTDGGVDCIGLLVGAARALNMPNNYLDINGYSHQPDGKSFAAWCSKYLDKLELRDDLPIQEQLADGDLLVFWIEHKAFPRHIAVYSTIDCKPHIIHSYIQARGVVEMPLTSQYWIPRIHAAYRVPEFEGVA